MLKSTELQDEPLFLKLLKNLYHDIPIIPQELKAKKNFQKKINLP